MLGPRSAFVVLSLSVVLSGCQSLVTTNTDAALEQKRVTINGAELTYVEEGAGQTVIFVHGAAGDWRTWANMRKRVASTHRFVSVSRRYHYPNSWSDDGTRYNFDQHVEDLAAFIRYLNVGNVHLVGSSYSGRMAGVLALRYPELLRSVVLGEPSLAMPGGAEGKAAMASYAAEMRKVAETAKAGQARQASILLFNTVNAPVTFDQVSAERQRNWLDNERTIGPMFSGATGAPVTCEQLGGIKVPAIVVGGANSRANFKLGNAALIACLPKGTQSVQVPGAPHIWGAHDPEFAARTIMAFIAKH